MLFEKQQYQEDCVNNIVSILDECDVFNNDYSNLKNIIKEHYKTQRYSQFETSNKKQIDVLMETGTGKTFTYIKTIFEINKQFGKTKFIIVLPRTAIKQGVIQNIKLTDEYFYNEYGKHLKFIDYTGKDSLSAVQQSFIRNESDLTVLVSTNSAFNKDANTINQAKEDLVEHSSVWEAIADKKPIVFIDEPHLLKGGATVEALEKLDSLFIRFGATYPTEEQHKLVNVAYALDSINSFENYLVKRIAVKNILTGAEESDIKITKIIAKGKQVDKSVTFSYSKNQQIYSTTIKIGDDVGSKTGLDIYHGVTLTKINAKEIFFSNGDTKKVSESYELNDDEIEKMLRVTISNHFEKEERLFKQGIKELSLFFIPSIADFRGDNPRVRKSFERIYREIRDEYYQNTTNQEYKKYLDNDFKDGKLQVLEGYFSGDKGDSAKDDDLKKAVDIILNKKEQLLSLDEPLRFVFSVWALQEGWDNPNIFNICKLATTDKETSRRQQVGRGLRLAVNQVGKRQSFKTLAENENAFYDINTLDVVVSGYEKDFIEGIQSEIQKASFGIVGDFLEIESLKDKGLNDVEVFSLIGVLSAEKVIEINDGKYKVIGSIYDFIENNADKLSFLSDARLQEIKELFKSRKPLVEDRNKAREKLKIRQEQAKKFKELWETINRKAEIVYKDINEHEIITKIADAFDKESFSQIDTKVITKVYDPIKDKVVTKEEQSLGKIDFFAKNKLSEFVFEFSKKEKLPLGFVTKLFSKLNLQKIKNNPSKAINFIKSHIKESIHTSILQCVDYDFSQTNIFSKNILQNDDGSFIKEIEYTKLGRNIGDEASDEFLFDRVVYDSDIEKQAILNDPTSIDGQQITVFAKLPSISIPTPYKAYNPDFAYLVDRGENQKQLFLVVETKGYKNNSDIPQAEKTKIDYAKKFFEGLQKQLPDVEIRFKTRVNKQELSNILQECQK
ncbi:DEAD/DEAH box helicase family protein [Francisella tularensis subsp. novicida]|uniref:DEAD/DEAH box helicase n=2 Tax=Francisella tularensis TaxID=263 RepID=A0A6I4RUJ8_FRATU|nr:DEAD/DEAH box helicase family protein [Francisella tularensis]ABK90354.1 restriction endonuclease [Francisella tularensis subsp. novicida U112]AJI61611.1 DEAD/DEAH box helicase family protein [Francisella tularensis subsp. novicida U112]EDX20127.1 type III restriction enzyme, res subunit family [Francisella tularensis subsp. novicida FTE]MBK2035952.1 DEAD/DEAH box helicase family protein [Francisella tularensis subsp. novicida]MBK2116601.1 DEAD/DEAH box helicase family protein [Francisella 